MKKITRRYWICGYWERNPKLSWKIVSEKELAGKYPPISIIAVCNPFQPGDYVRLSGEKGK